MNHEDSYYQLANPNSSQSEFDGKVIIPRNCFKECKRLDIPGYHEELYIHGDKIHLSPAFTINSVDNEYHVMQRLKLTTTNQECYVYEKIYHADTVADCKEYVLKYLQEPITLEIINGER